MHTAKIRKVVLKSPVGVVRQQATSLLPLPGPPTHPLSPGIPPSAIGHFALPETLLLLPPWREHPGGSDRTEAKEDTVRGCLLGLPQGVDPPGLGGRPAGPRGGQPSGLMGRDRRGRQLLS